MKYKNSDVLFGVLMFLGVVFPVVAVLSALTAVIIVDIFSNISFFDQPLFPIRVPLLLGCIAFWIWCVGKLK